MDPSDGIANGLNNISLDPPAQRKKKTARAHHQLGAMMGSPALPQQAPFSSVGAIPNVPINNGTIFNTAPAAIQNIAGSLPEQGQQQGFQPTDSPGDDPLNVTFRRHLGQQEYRTTPFKTFSDVLPPTAVTRMTCIDQSNAAPKFARLSMYSVPESETLRASTRLPLGLTVRPFAPLDYTEEPVPEVDLTNIGGPPRCRRCRTYINPATVFTHDQKFVCNMCDFPNQVPSEYTCALDQTHRRLDILQRPELHRGVVDFIVPPSYWVEDNVQPKPMHHIFLIDVSAPTDVVIATTEAIRSSLPHLPTGVKIAIMSYDQTIHFYNLESENVQAVVSSDLEDPFVPIYSGLFVDPNEYSTGISATLNYIENAYTNYKPNEVAYGAALKYSLEALKLVGGGKVTALLCRLPSWGPGSLTMPIDSDQGSDVFKCTNEYYQRLADEYIAHNAGIDLFVVCPGSVSLINSANITFKTSGLLKLYNNFTPERDERQYCEDIKTSILNTRGYQAQLKVRCSNGLQVSSYYGNFNAKGSNDPVLPILSTDQQFSVLFSYDSKLTTGRDAHFQTALLYTGIDGQRRVRVINVVASVTEKVSDVFAFADQDTVTDIIVKNCLHYVSKQQPIEVKNSTKSKIVDILTQYRSLVSQPTSLPSQLVVPDGLGSLGAFINAFQKSKIFRTSVSNNFKIYDFYQLNSLPLETLMYFLYPCIISLVELAENECTYDENGLFVMPQNIRASHQALKYGGAYFVFNGKKLFLFIHPNVNPLFVADLFGVHSLDQISGTLNELPELDTHINLQARNIVHYFKTFLRLEFLGLQLVRPGSDGSEFEFSECLVEDRTLDKTESYNDFITSIHRQIRANLDENKHSSSSVFSGDNKHDDSTLAQRFVQF